MMSERNLLIILAVSIIAILVFGVVIWGPQFSQPTSPSSGAVLGTSAISAEETAFDFGTISMKNGRIKHNFKIKNPTENPTTVSKIYSSCMCTEAVLIKSDTRKGPYGMQGHGFIPTINEVFSSGEEAVIEVTFDPNAHGPAGVGPIERSVTIEQQSSGSLNLGIKATVTP